MDETHRRTFQPLSGVRWGAVATGALLGAAVWLVLLRFVDVPLSLTEVEPGFGRRLWWVMAPLLAAGVASWMGASASGEQGIRDAYLHGFLAWAGALLLAALVGPGHLGVLPQTGWSGLATVVGAVVGGALGRAFVAGRVTVPRIHSGQGGEVRPRAPWRDVLLGRRGSAEGRGAGTHESAKGVDQDLH